jgi:hypothetical protein
MAQSVAELRIVSDGRMCATVPIWRVALTSSNDSFRERCNCVDKRIELTLLACRLPYHPFLCRRQRRA